MSYNLRPLPQFGAPRCSWLQRLIDGEQAQREAESIVRVTRLELQSFRRDAARKGYDPYNSAALTPEWLRLAPPDALVPVPKFRRDYR